MIDNTKDSVGLLNDNVTRDAVIAFLFLFEFTLWLKRAPLMLVSASLYQPARQVLSDLNMIKTIL